MMIKECTDAQSLQSIFEAWEAEYNGNAFDIQAEVNIAISHVHQLINTPHCVVLVLYDVDEPVGFMGVTIFSSPISDTKMATEHLWYVKPEFRGAKAIKMLDAAISWAKHRGCSHFLGNASMLASNLHDTVCKIYEGFGMKKFETTYIKTLEV